MSNYKIEHNQISLILLSPLRVVGVIQFYPTTSVLFIISYTFGILIY